MFITSSYFTCKLQLPAEQNVSAFTPKPIKPFHIVVTPFLYARFMPGFLRIKKKRLLSASFIPD
ncbi:hypothetical protein A6R78_16135 [Bacillus velezensis]|nr:hypothetical protein A6R78_16135 [Bacillus velezensis]